MSDSVSVVVSKPEKVGGIRKKYDTSKNKSSYSSKSLPYDKRNIERNTQSQVTAFRKSYKEVSPIAQMMVDQILDPEVVSSAVRFPTYGVSALYPAKNVAQCRYDANGRSSVIVSPMLRNAILATTGATFDQTLKASGTADHPYGRQTLNILPSDGEVSFSSLSSLIMDMLSHLVLILIQGVSFSLCLLQVREVQPVSFLFNLEMFTQLLRFV